MHFGMRRLNKRQIKKLINENYFGNEKRYNNLYKAGMWELSAIASMYNNGKDKLQILIKAENAFKYCLKVCNLNFERFLEKYPNYNRPYLEGCSIDEAFGNLASEASYISDRYGEYRLHRFFHYIELCRYMMKFKTYTPIVFETQDNVIGEAMNIFNKQLEKTIDIEQFSNYYNERIQELIEVNGNEYNPYDDLFFSTPYKVVENVRYVLNYVKGLLTESENLNKFHLYQLTHTIRQAERIMAKKLLPQNVVFM